MNFVFVIELLNLFYSFVVSKVEVIFGGIVNSGAIYRG